MATTTKRECEGGKIVAAEYLSLDGVTEDPGLAGDFEHRGWTVPYWNDELAELQSELLFASDALLLGRLTWEEFVGLWVPRTRFEVSSLELPGCRGRRAVGSAQLVVDNQDGRHPSPSASEDAGAGKSVQERLSLA
jgi:hypothetical protein